MLRCSENKTPLIHGGCSQSQRALSALDPASAPLINQHTVDWIVWGRKMAEQLRYYDHRNQPVGSLKVFFGSGIASRLAMVATHKSSILPSFFRQHFTTLQTNSNLTQPDTMRRSLQSIFEAMLGYLASVDMLQLDLASFTRRFPQQASELGFGAFLTHHLQASLLPLAHQIMVWYKTCDHLGLLIQAHPPAILIFQETPPTGSRVIQQGLSSTWWQGEPSWQQWLDTLVAEPAWIDVPGGAGPQIQHVAQHNLFTGLPEQISGSAAILANQALQSLHQLLSHWPYHEPHNALWLTFLKLLEHANQGINLLTGRHLDFYYQQVLRMQKRAASPGRVVIVTQLAKTTTQTAVEAGTGFLGPKNALGKPTEFAAVRTTVLNQARLTHLMKWYMADAESNLPWRRHAGRLFAAPIANSADGNGSQLDTPQGEWHPFYNKRFENGVLTDIDMPEARLGFAFSSHYLRLAEGRRTIRLRLRVDQPFLLAGQVVTVRITTEKEWLDLGDISFANDKFWSDGITEAVLLECTLKSWHPPITGYVPKVHQGSLQTNEPVIQVLLRHTLNDYIYPALLNLQLIGAELEVEVGNWQIANDHSGLRNLELISDQGTLDPSKPFMPFGAEPIRSNGIIIGSPELAVKPGAIVKLNLTWKDLPNHKSNLVFKPGSNPPYPTKPGTASGYSPRVRLQCLGGSNWQNLIINDNLFSFIGNRISKTTILSHAITVAEFYRSPTLESASYTASTRQGYLRLLLSDDFGHRNYRQAYTHYLLEKGLGKSPTVVQEPYLPVLESLTLSYQARATWQASDALSSPMKFWHLHPFGHAAITPAPGSTQTALLPSLADSEDPLRAQGSLVLGFSDLSGGQSVSILFQMMEGTANPLRTKPANHLQWSYLSQNNWKPLSANAIQDGTQSWLSSGILHVAIPPDASLDNTIFADVDKGEPLLYLRASVKNAPDAVCKIMGIHPQAFEVQQVMHSESEEGLPNLPAATITKPALNTPQIKKIEQPYAGYGATTLESNQIWYQRVSERLRHKDRAVTLWDYEHLVLEQFPEIYKVKCLNHTRLEGNVADGNLEYNEVAPGHVAIITIPRMQQRNDTDPLKPYTRKDTLEAIMHFLNQRISCHVKLRAMQPRFETLRLAATVALLPGYTDIQYYTAKLQQELTQWLSPWAFGNIEGGPEFGGTIQKSVLINFLEEQPYVDYLTDVQLFHQPGDDALEGPDVNVVKASSAASVLVSAPAHTHQFLVKTAVEVAAVPKPCND